MTPDLRKRAAFPHQASITAQTLRRDLPLEELCSFGCAAVHYAATCPMSVGGDATIGLGGGVYSRVDGFPAVAQQVAMGPMSLGAKKVAKAAPISGNGAFLATFFLEMPPT